MKQDTSANETLHNLLLPLVNLIQEALEHLPLKLHLPIRTKSALRDSLNQANNLLIRLLLILPKLLRDPNLIKHLLDLLLGLAIFPSIVSIKNSPLFRCGMGEGSVDTPRTFVVDDVCADFADLFGGAAEVEPVVLDLEVFAERDKDGGGDGEGVFGRVGDGLDARDVKGKSDGEVERVVSSLVDDDETVSKKDYQ